MSQLKHDSYFNELRKKEYQRLAKGNHVYLDYTGGNLYGDSLLLAHQDLLRNSVLGNPHSSNPTSLRATKLVEEARQKVLDFFNANDHYCIFTQNASGALKIVGECYPFEENGHYLLFADNHNSVNGIRKYCSDKSGKHEYVTMNYENLSVDEDLLKDKLTNSKAENKLFAFPAQSNVSGIKHDLEYINDAKNKGWDVLLDAAAFVPTSKLDLSVYPADFVSVSFYKIFGYPTGIGCLLVKKEAFQKLEKRWFAGGTVGVVAVNSPHHILMNNHERFENGTINYLDIPAVKIGLDFIERIGIERINERVNSLMDYLFQAIKNETHTNGQKQLAIFGAPDRSGTGGTMLVNFLNPDGSQIDFNQIENRTNERNISIRSGCFCNPGLDEIKNCITTEELSQYFSRQKEGSFDEMIRLLQKMRGATRISVGLATTKEDLDYFIAFVKEMKDQSIE